MTIARNRLLPALICCSLVLTACHGSSTESGVIETSAVAVKQDPNSITLDENSLAAIETEAVEIHKLPFVIEATGQLQANANVVTRVSSPLSGKVTTVHATIGEHVKAGQILATVTSQDVSRIVTDFFKSETEIDSDLTKELLEIDCELEQESAETQLAQKQYERTRVLVEEKISSLAELERSKTVVDKHTLSMMALDKKRKRVIKVADDRKNLERSSFALKLTLLGIPILTVDNILNKHEIVNAFPIIASQAGFVLERNVNVGELIEPSRILFEVDDIDNLWLVADVFEQDVEAISKGQQIEFTVDSFPKERFVGKLDFVAGTINPETRTLSIRATIANPRFKLKPKMFARLKVFTGEQPVLAVSKVAIQDAGSRKVVYLKVGDNKFQERQVQTGEEADGYIQIREGLKEGDLVVTRGAFTLRSYVLKQAR